VIDNFLFDGPMTFMIICELMIITAFSLTYKSKRNKNVWLKILMAAALIIVVKLLDYYFVDFNTASTALQAPICFIATFTYACLALKIPVKEALYCTIWSYIITEIANQIVMPITDPLVGGSSGIIYYLKYIFTFSVGIFATFYLVKVFLIKKLQTNEHYHVGRQKILLSVLVACLYMLLSNYQFIFWLLGFEPESRSNMITFFRLIVGLACALFLYMQNSIEKRQMAEQELDMIQQLWYRQQDQYKLSQENIDLINRKCHDLKYQMAALRKLDNGDEINAQLREMEDYAMIYDSVVKTKNPVLDTVLTEKSLYCEAHQINMTRMVDGTKLDFVGKVDLYTMFGNALDNAIESVMKQRDIEKRVIQVAVFHEKNLLLIRVRNYCEEKIKFISGLPASTKQDKGYHGFGLKSIQYTAEKYGGGIVCQAIDNYFVLQILLPIPEKIK